MVSTTLVLMVLRTEDHCWYSAVFDDRIGDVGRSDTGAPWAGEMSLFLKVYSTQEANFPTS